MNTYTKNGAHLKCSMSGKFDTLNSLSLETEIHAEMHPGVASVEFDLRDVHYISSTFLRVAIGVAKTVGRDRFTITNAQPPVLKVLKIANITELIRTE